MRVVVRVRGNPDATSLHSLCVVVMDVLTNSSDVVECEVVDVLTNGTAARRSTADEVQAHVRLSCTEADAALVEADITDAINSGRLSVGVRQVQPANAIVDPIERLRTLRYQDLCSAVTCNPIPEVPLNLSFPTLVLIFYFFLVSHSRDRDVCQWRVPVIARS